MCQTPNPSEILSLSFLTIHLRSWLPFNRWETSSEKEANSPRSLSWQARSMKSGLLTPSLKFLPLYHVSRIAQGEDHEFPTKVKVLILIWVQAHFFFFFWVFQHELTVSGPKYSQPHPNVSFHLHLNSNLVLSNLAIINLLSHSLAAGLWKIAGKGICSAPYA